jgi:hypothetical protein
VNENLKIFHKAKTSGTFQAARRVKKRWRLSSLPILKLEKALDCCDGWRNGSKSICGGSEENRRVI